MVDKVHSEEQQGAAESDAPYFFRASSAEFFPAALRQRYEEAGTWPSDGIPVTKEEFETYSVRAYGRPAGMMVGAGDDGRPCWVERPLEASEIRRDKAWRRIDWAADLARAADRSIGKYLDAEYQIVAEALVAYRNDPEGEVPEAVQSYADAEGLTVESAAEQIAEAAARAVELLQEVRRIRLAGKAAVRDAADDADMLEVARPFIDELEALATA